MRLKKTGRLPKSLPGIKPELTWFRVRYGRWGHSADQETDPQNRRCTRQCGRSGCGSSLYFSSCIIRFPTDGIRNSVLPLLSAAKFSSLNIICLFSPFFLWSMAAIFSFSLDVYYRLGLDRICWLWPKKHHFEYNLNVILFQLIYAWILFLSKNSGSFKPKTTDRKSVV